eukprot:gnl/TRDRNA2_/TRDRNA2_85539_c0_seq1.p1 gnl/TRDRNA2_/TRDRNA2_85539_c0~~gnl/TRDRNA2_/TRDRNA2_85539_c0_seq1.p1  ORF type:complete len:613 (-),score=79.03 gnl/TRDRNA2_/TRDRNA2_85539_c0_seq1:968-2806(-)
MPSSAGHNAGAQSATRSTSNVFQQSAPLKRGTTNMEVDLNNDLAQFMDAEKNADMKRVLGATVGRAAAHKKTVSKDIFVEYVEHTIESEHQCFHFPLTILYFTFFAVTLLAHEDITNVSQVERNYRSMLEGTTFEGLDSNGIRVPTSGHKDMNDIDMVSDVYTYLREAILPLFINPTSGDMLPKDLNRVLRYNQIIGGVQLQQTRREKKLCGDLFPTVGPHVMVESTDPEEPGEVKQNPLFIDFYCYPYASISGDCFGPGNLTEGFCPRGHADINRTYLFDSLLNNPITRRLSTSAHHGKVKSRSSEALTGISMSNKPIESFIVGFHEHQGIDVAISKLNRLQELNWIDEATSWLGIKMFMMNPDLAVYTHIVIHIYFPPSGEIIPYVALQSFPAEPYLDQSVLALDIIFMLLWVHLTCVNGMDLARAMVFHQAGRYLKNGWNYVAWLTILGALVIIGLWTGFVGMLGGLGSIVAKVASERPQPSDDVSLDFAFKESRDMVQYVRDTETLHTQVAQMAGFLSLYRLFICWYTLLIMARFFQAFQAQPRLAVVTNTVLRSLTDVLHFFCRNVCDLHVVCGRWHVSLRPSSDRVLRGWYRHPRAVHYHAGRLRL